MKYLTELALAYIATILTALTALHAYDRWIDAPPCTTDTECRQWCLEHAMDDCD